MHNPFSHLSFSPLSLCFGAAATLALVYVGLIAVVMSYAVLTIEYAQSVKNDEAAVAQLESQYLSSVALVEGVDYRAAGHAKPAMKTFVPAASVTALR